MMEWVRWYLNLLQSVVAFVVANQVDVLLYDFIFGAFAGMYLDLRIVQNALRDKQFLRTANINSILLMIADIHYVETLALLYVNVVCAVLGIVIFALRTDDSPDTLHSLSGHVMVISFFSILLVLQAVTLFVHYRRQMLVGRYVSKDVRVVVVKADSPLAHLADAENIGDLDAH